MKRGGPSEKRSPHLLQKRELQKTRGNKETPLGASPSAQTNLTGKQLDPDSMMKELLAHSLKKVPMELGRNDNWSDFPPGTPRTHMNRYQLCAN